MLSKQKNKGLIFKNFFKDTYLHMIGRLFVIFLEGISVILIAKIFAPQDKGYLSLLMLVVAYAHQIGELGIYQSAVYFQSKYQSIKSKNYVPNILSLGNFVSAILSVVLIIILFIANKLGFINIKTNIIFLLSIILLTLSINNILYHLLIGQKKILQYVISKIFQSLLFLSSNFIVWKSLSNFEIYHTLICYIFSFLTLFVLLIIIHKKNNTDLNPKVSLKIWKEILKFSLRGHPGRILWNLNNKLDFFIINYFLGTFFVGVYSIAVTIAETLTFFASSIGAMLLTYVASSDKNEGKILSNLIIKNTFYLTCIAALFLIIIGPFFITFFFDTAYHGSVIPFFCLIPGVISLSVSRIISNHLIGVGKPELQSYGVAFAFIIMIILNLILTPNYGIVGAAISSSVAYIFESFIIIFFYLRDTSQKYTDVFSIRKHDLKIYSNLLKKLLPLNYK